MRDLCMIAALKYGQEESTLYHTRVESTELYGP